MQNLTSRNKGPCLHISIHHDARVTSDNTDSGYTLAHPSPEVAPAAKKRTSDKRLQIRTVNMPPRERARQPQCGVTILEEP